LATFPPLTDGEIIITSKEGFCKDKESGLVISANYSPVVTRDTSEDLAVDSCGPSGAGPVRDELDKKSPSYFPIGNSEIAAAAKAALEEITSIYSSGLGDQEVKIMLANAASTTSASTSGTGTKVSGSDSRGVSGSGSGVSATVADSSVSSSSSAQPSLSLGKQAGALYTELVLS